MSGINSGGGPTPTAAPTWCSLRRSIHGATPKHRKIGPASDRPRARFAQAARPLLRDRPDPSRGPNKGHVPCAEHALSRIDKTRQNSRRLPLRLRLRDRKSGGEGKRMSVSVDIGGCGRSQKKNKKLKTV